ncbi:5971_t:CDS:2, partial [Funneliformis geosporum]
KNSRREYVGVNRSPLFRDLPEHDYTREQKLSYSKFLYERLPQLLSFYFPAEFSDYNNNVIINIKDVECREPETVVEDAKGKKKIKPQSEEEARERSNLSSSELKTLLTKTKKQLKELPEQ